MKKTGSNLPLERARAVGEEHKRNRRRKRESDPRRETAEIPGAHQTKREPDLAACRPRQKLAQRHKIGVSVLVEPTTTNDELLPEIADVSDRTAEAAHAELRKRKQDLNRRARSVTIFARRGYGHSLHGVRPLAGTNAGRAMQPTAAKAAP